MPRRPTGAPNHGACGRCGALTHRNRPLCRRCAPGACEVCAAPLRDRGRGVCPECSGLARRLHELHLGDGAGPPVAGLEERIGRLGARAALRLPLFT